MQARSQRRLRQAHLWLGLLFAPSIIFFSLTGTVQALGFQDRSATYVPPAWIDVVTSVHKHGTVWRTRKPQGAPAQPPRQREGPGVPASSGPVLFSLFAALLGLLLAVTSALGSWIAFLDRRGRRVNGLALLAGVMFPIMLLLS